MVEGQRSLYTYADDMKVSQNGKIDADRNCTVHGVFEGLHYFRGKSVVSRIT